MCVNVLIGISAGTHICLYSDWSGAFDAAVREFKGES